MINAIYLALAAAAIAGQKTIQKPFAEKTGGKGVCFYNAFTCFAAMLFFLFSGGAFEVDAAFVPYSIIFAVAYSLATIFSMLALSYGPLSLTALCVSYSLILPTFYGIIVLKDKIGTFLIPGIILWVISLFLINKKVDGGGKISFKWVVFILLAFIGNGGCSITQKQQQLDFNGQYKNEFMVVAMAVATLIAFVVGLFMEKKEGLRYAAAGVLPALFCGVINGGMNLLVMILTGNMAVSVVFPIISAGSIILSYLASTFIFKEKLTKIQIIGFFVGILAVILLNI